MAIPNFNSEWKAYGASTLYLNCSKLISSDMPFGWLGNNNYFTDVTNMVTGFPHQIPHRQAVYLAAS